MIRKWAWRNLAREALGNTFVWRSRGWAVVVIAILLGTGQVFYMVATWQHFADDTNTQIDEGRNVFDLAAPNATRPVDISRSSCDAISDDTSVTAAGALVDLGRTSFVQLGQSVQVFGVSATLVPTLADHDVVVGSALGLEPGDATVFGPKYGSLSGVVGSENESSLGVASAVLVPLPPSVSTVAACTVVLDRYDTDSARLTASVDATGPLLPQPRTAESYDLTTNFLQRIDRYLPLVVGAVGGLIAAFQYRLRTSEAAAYRLSGTSRADLSTLYFLEQSLAASTMALSGVAAVFLLQDHLEAPASIASWVLLSAITWMISFAVIVVPMVYSDPTKLAKER